MLMNKGLKEYNDKKRLGLIPEPERLDPIEKSRQNPTSLRLAINARCYNCTGFIKMDVTNCDMPDCELFKVRPYQKDTVALKNSVMKKYSHSDKKILQERCNSDYELLPPYGKLKDNPKSRRAAINAFCFWCSCEQRKEVRLCPSDDCPLHHLRPWQSKNNISKSFKK